MEMKLSYIIILIQSYLIFLVLSLDKTNKKCKSLSDCIDNSTCSGEICVCYEGFKAVHGRILDKKCIESNNCGSDEVCFDEKCQIEDKCVEEEPKTGLG